jgi:hypothetical protein
VGTESLPRLAFYSDIVGQSFPDKNASILVCGGALLDFKVLRSLGYQNVTITNYDVRENGDSYLPYSWALEDATDLTYEDKASGDIGFDQGWGESTYGS